MDPPTISDLIAKVENHNRSLKYTDPEISGNIKFQFCVDAKDADVILTVVHMQKRLERHVPWAVAVSSNRSVQCRSSPSMQRHKTIVTPQWLLDSLHKRKFLAYGTYLALRNLRREEQEASADGDDTQYVQAYSTGPQIDGAPPAPMSPRSIAQLTGDNNSYQHPYACMRLCPLVCPNQALVDQLGIIKVSRELEGQGVNALAYERAISVGIISIRFHAINVFGSGNQRSFSTTLTTYVMELNYSTAYPHIIDARHFEKDITHAPHIGEKLFSKVGNILGWKYPLEQLDRFMNILKPEKYEKAVSLFHAASCSHY